MNPPAQAIGGKVIMYINPGLISIYETDYLVTVLRKPTIPSWLKRLIAQELQKRGIALSVSKPGQPADIVVRPFKIEKTNEFNICYNGIEAYITLSSQCPEY